MMYDNSALAAMLEKHRGELQRTFGFSSVIGKSGSMRQVMALIDDAARTDATVLLCGENGTGRSLIANTIHEISRRCDGPFCSLRPWGESTDDSIAGLFRPDGAGDGNGTPLSNGIVSAAEFGTIFVRELMDCPHAIQQKLEGALEPTGAGGAWQGNKRVSYARFIASAGPNVMDSVRRGRLRGRLVELLSATRIDVPPLRERPEDIPLLFAYFYDRLAKQSRWRLERVSPEAWQVLAAYAWPGNVEELKGLVMLFRERGLGPAIEAKDLPGCFKDGAHGAASTSAEFQGNLDASLSRFERTQILLALSRTGGQKSKAADILGIPRSRLYRRMVSLGIHQPDGAAKRKESRTEVFVQHGSEGRAME